MDPSESLSFTNPCRPQKSSEPSLFFTDGTSDQLLGKACYFVRMLEEDVNTDVFSNQSITNGNKSFLWPRQNQSIVHPLMIPESYVRELGTVDSLETYKLLDAGCLEHNRRKIDLDSAASVLNEASLAHRPLIVGW